MLSKNFKQFVVKSTVLAWAFALALVAGCHAHGGVGI
jgi:hypothetical protein